MDRSAIRRDVRPRIFRGDVRTGSRLRILGDAVHPSPRADDPHVALIRSLIRCSIGVPHYGKLVVTGIDTVANTVTFLVMVNQNCGYRGLETGLPDN